MQPKNVLGKSQTLQYCILTDTYIPVVCNCLYGTLLIEMIIGDETHYSSCFTIPRHYWYRYICHCSRLVCIDKQQ